MKAIYDAVRAIAYPGNAQHKAGLSPVQLAPNHGMCFMSESNVEALVLEQATARGI